MQYVNFNQGEITWHGLNQQHKICVLASKSLCISQIVNFLLINKILTKSPEDWAFLFSKRLTQKINKTTIETMMKSALLHKSFISLPECGQPAYWGMLTRDISNRVLGDYRT